MKRTVCWIATLFVLLVTFTGCYRISMSRGAEVTLRYGHRSHGGEETLRSFTLTDAEAQTVRRHLRAAKYLRVGAGCSFKNGSGYEYMYSLTFDDGVVAMAFDDCHTLWDVRRDRYYEMTDEGWTYLTDLCNRYLEVTEYPYYA